MEFLKKLFKDEDKIIGLCAFKEEDEEKLSVYVPKFNPSKTIYTTNYQKNFFLL